MQLLLLGDHPDGVDAAVALAQSGRHALAAYAGPANTAARLRQQGLAPAVFDDAETALAVQTIDLVLVADELPHRPALLRRALQSDKHVAVVHPADLEPDIAYEALLLQQDTKKLLIPFLPERMAAALNALHERQGLPTLGALQQLELEVRFPAPRPGGAPVKKLPREWEGHPLLTLWEPLRLLGGEIQDLTAVSAEAEELAPAAALVLTGRMQSGALFQVSLTPQPAGLAAWRFTVRGEGGELCLDAPQGLFGATTLRHPAGEQRFEAEERRGALLARLIEAALDGRPSATWTDATRCLELFDAARRSVKRKRMVAMDYEAVSETGNFKSTMTALGCVVLLIIMTLFYLTPTLPFAKYLIIPILALFLGLQALRWIIKDETPKP
jgi:predicted dehydrogenase